ncbi:uncharacterized protein CTHT_0009480 [Thermochaetoides thermophila DSM 1495]|uniref:Uncharacterized protein n=1 Tax=Chaetomium thermophilum (strain DSM 1495 / CBS 144.50 / IMI 039719) TaxID=759272 RepID=G0S0C0_CHATD|nr:hypothetical protein CTHT_0009480 [Thermochaetoides thermophila DSM 1495]EGS23281.1 hypothetical protein CTHT_0009480 [Thermochaetoides thermophila DSM 1495]
MDGSSKDIANIIQKTLEPYIRPREEVTRIRQILAAHLNSCLQDGAAALALVNTSSPSLSPAAQGLHKDYLEALDANIKARKEFSSLSQRRPESTLESPNPSIDDGGLNRLQDLITTIRLRQKLDKLQAIAQGLNVLSQKPAASPRFLDSSEVFKDSRPLPEVPRNLITAITVNKANQTLQLRDLSNQLEKHVLQAKLLLKREEQLLKKVRSRSTASPEKISPNYKLEALNKTRVELINWIESELSKAGGEEDEGEIQNRHKQHGESISIQLDEQLASIKEKYAQYLEARKYLLQLVSQQPKPVVQSPAEEQKPLCQPTSPAPITYLLAPYVQQLLALSHEQKTLIAHKSHLYTIIGKQLKESNQVLNHLAEESHLMPAHPMPGGIRPPTLTSGAIGTSDISGPSNWVKPWVFAADSAKIATLEAVAEKIDEGQLALEGTMRTLGEIDEFLGTSANIGEQESPAEQARATGAEGSGAKDQPTGRHLGSKRNTIKVEKPATLKTVWDTLDGGLGLP